MPKIVGSRNRLLLSARSRASPGGVCNKAKRNLPPQLNRITDYFVERKSTRKCQSTLKKESRDDVERKVLAGVQDGLEVRHTVNKGRGVFATRRFERGEFVCEYAGEMIEYPVARHREQLYASAKPVNSITADSCYMYFFEHKSKRFCIDATEETDRLGRLINHSKSKPNCSTKIVEIQHRPHLVLIASRDIQIGEEITYDYGDRSKEAVEAFPWLAD